MAKLVISCLKNISEITQISMVKLVEDDYFFLKKILPNTDIIEFESIEDNKTQMTKMGIQKINKENNGTAATRNSDEASVQSKLMKVLKTPSKS